MKLYLFLALTLTPLCLSGCAAPAKTLRIGGDDAIISSFLVPVKEAFEEETKTYLSVVQIKQGEELLELKGGDVDAIITANSLPELLHEAEARKVVVPRDSLYRAEVGRNRTVVLLHQKNRIKQLNQKQLQSIFTGKLKNWRELGGPEQDIIVVWDKTATAENEAFARKILKGASVHATMKAVDTFEGVRKTVMEIPGAIGIAPSGFIAPGLKVPKTPSVSAPVTIVAKGKPSPQLLQLVDILKDAAYIQ